MKKIILLIIPFIVSQSYTQQELNKISDDATMVLSFSLKNFLAKVPQESINTSPFFNFLQNKALRGVDKKITVADLGLDLSKNIYYATENSKDISCFFIMYPLTNKSKFESILNKEQWNQKVKGKGYEGYKSEYNNSYILFDKNTAIFIYINYNGNAFPSLYDSDYYLREAMVNDVLKEYLKSGELVKEYEKIKKKYEALKIERAKEAYYNRKPVDYIPVNSYDYADYYDRKAEVEDYFYFKADEEREELRKKLEEDEKIVFNLRFESFFNKNGHINPISKSSSFNSKRDENADAIFWSKSGIVSPMFYGVSSYNYLLNYGGMNNSTPSSGAVTTNLYLDKSQARAEMYTVYGDSIKKYLSKILSTRISDNMLSYISSEAVGYYTLSINSEEMLHALPYFYSSTYRQIQPNFESEIGLAMDFLRVMLDEKETSQLLTGDAIFVLLGLKMQEVTYETYEIDEDYNYKEVTKTKQQLMPQFRFALTSNRTDLFEKIMKLMVQKGMFSSENGFYKLIENKENKRKLPFTVYIKQEKGVILFSTQEEDMKGIKPASISEKQKNNLKAGSVVAYFDPKKMLEQIPQDQISTMNDRKMYNYLVNNTRDISFVQTLQNGDIKGELIFNIPETESNSGIYFLNLLNELTEFKKGE